jgi:hypothetical protein
MSTSRFAFSYRRRLLLKRVVLTVFGLAVVTALATLYVAMRVGSDLASAQQAIGASPTNLAPQQLASARTNLDAAAATLHSFPATVLRYVPVLGQNLDAVKATTDAASPVLNASLGLRSSVQRSLSGGMINSGTIKVDAIKRLREPLDLQLKSLAALHRAIDDHLSGMLVPGLYTRLDELSRQVASYQQTVAGADDLLKRVPAMVGAGVKRTYLVTFLNNSELRGAGGIMSGIGTVTFSGGRISLGKFRYYQDIRRLDPAATVKTPPDYHRRFARYNAGTARWVNTSASPQVPEVATVAARLYKAATGVSTDGVILVDPRGIQALLPPTNVLTVGTGKHVSTAALPSYVYSGAYTITGSTTQRDRHQALIQVGRAAFARASSRSVGELGGITRIGSAISAGHLRLVSFHKDEEKALDNIGASGRIPAQGTDSVLVNVQNFGGDKLDYWAERSVVHRCGVDSNGSALCETVVRIHNRAPDNLPEYVVGSRRRPNMISEVDVYVPAAADVKSVTNRGSPARYFSEGDFGRTSIGTYVHIPPHSTGEVRVVYRIPPSPDGYSLMITPQPLARDASLDVQLALPRGWIQSEGPGLLRAGRYDYSAPLTGPVSLRMGPPHRPGLTAVWDHLVHFWDNPV